MTPKLKITTAYVFGNGMVMVFDQHDEQMPEYQGEYADVIEKIRAVYSGPIVATDWVNPHVKTRGAGFRFSVIGDTSKG